MWENSVIALIGKREGPLQRGLVEIGRRIPIEQSLEADFPASGRIAELTALDVSLHRKTLQDYRAVSRNPQKNSSMEMFNVVFVGRIFYIPYHTIFVVRVTLNLRCLSQLE